MPMGTASNGPVLLDSYLPDEAATIVERALDAGAIILGKAVCESLCFSGAARSTPPAGPRALGCRR
jgi:amidase